MPHTDEDGEALLEEEPEVANPNHVTDQGGVSHERKFPKFGIGF